MKKNQSQSSSAHHKSESASMERESSLSKSSHAKTLNIAPLNLNALSSNSGSQLDSGLEMSGNHKNSKTSSSQNYEKYYIKLSSLIKDIYLEIKHKTIDENQNCAMMLKKVIPFDEDDEKTLSTDPAILVQYIKQIYDKNYDLKTDAEKELSSKKESECSDYEAMLQKLEAEVRQHIRIEQQLKLYVESTQAKLDELEKTHDPTKMEAMKKELDELRSENYSLNEKFKKKDGEIDTLRKDLRNKVDTIQNLEGQVENIPMLKNKIRDLEKMLSNEAPRPSTNTLKSHNGPQREGENYSKTINLSNNVISYDNAKARKGSQPVIGLQTSELTKYKVAEKERNKENIEVIRLDASTKLSRDQPKYKENNYPSEKPVRETVRPDSGKSFTRYDEKMEEFANLQSKLKKAQRSDSSRNLSQDKYHKEPEHSDYDERVQVQGRPSYQKVQQQHDMIEQSKFSTDKIFKPSSNYREEDARRQSTDKGEYRSKTKSDHLLKRSDSRPPTDYPSDTAEVNSANYSNKNFIPKPTRSSSGYDSLGGADISKYRKEVEHKEVSKAKQSSPKKSFQDRSHSVDATHKFYRQNKSKGDNYDTRGEEYGKAPIHEQQHQYKYGSGFNATQNMSGAYVKAHY